MNLLHVLIVVGLVWEFPFTNCDSLYSKFRRNRMFRRWNFRRPQKPPMFLQNSTSTPSILPELERLSHLDESLSRCGQFQIDIRELTISKTQHHFMTGKLTSLELTECYLNRISRMDVHLKSVIEVNPEAISIAKKADAERAAKPRGLSPLHGIPILLKDSIGTADLMQTTVGALALENLKPKRDADIVKRLRDAGAVIIGKTNPSEWAYFRGTGIPSGWSGRGGQTLSAYVLNEDPSGSSSGSGVATSANFAVVSIGTETDGSINSPSSRNALVGLKPTLGAVSTRGVIPLAFSHDVVGPMTRTAADAAILMGVISDVDLHGCNIDISACYSNTNFKIGVLRHPFWNTSDAILKKTMPVLETSLDRLKLTGQVEVIDPVIGNIDILNGVGPESEFTVFRHEFKHSINIYLEQDVKHLEGKLGRSIRSLSDIINFNERNPSKEGYNQSQLISSNETNGLLNSTYIQFREQNRARSAAYLNTIFARFDVDALAAPCFSDDDTTNLYSYGAFAGYPTISVPVGIDQDGMPLGICLTGPSNSESVLLKLAYLFEKSQLTKRAMPQFKISS